MRPLVDELIAGTGDRKASFERLAAALANGASVGAEGVAAAETLANALFAEPSPRDPILVARALGRLTLGHVEWLELRGADGVGTRARGVLDARRADVKQLAASSDERLRGAGIWLATVAAFYDALPVADGSLTSWIAEAHRVRATSGDAEFVARAQQTFESQAPREERLGAALAWCLVQSGREYLELDGFKDAFLRSVPTTLALENVPFRLGFVGDLSRAVCDLGYCTSWEREKVGGDPHWFFEKLEPEPESDPDPEPESELDEDETNPYMIGAPRTAPRAFTLSGLDTVDWPSLEDAYGHAGAVPRFLQSLASTEEKEREWALHSLYAGINHQGSTYSASVAAVPFLVTLALEPSVPERDDVLELLTGLATGEPAWALLEHVYPTLSIDAICAEAPRLIALLKTPEVDVRASAIHLLGHLEAKRDVIAPALLAALETEEDPYLRPSLVMALARVTRRSGDARARDAAARVASESELGRAVAALCPYYEREPLERGERAALHALDQKRYRVHPSYRWNRGNIAAHARAIHKATMPIGEALDALERGERDCQPRASELLFPPESWKKEELFLPEELSSDQMRFLRWAVQHEQAYYEGIWREAGLPNTATWLKRFLGVLPPGPCDRRVTVQGKGDWPIWKLIHNVQTNRVPESEWQRIARALEFDELLAVYDDVTSTDFHFDWVREYLDSLDPVARDRGTAYRDRFYRLLLDALVEKPELLPTFEARADEILKAADDRNYLVRTLLFAGLGLAKKRAGSAIEARHAALAEPGEWSPAMTLIEPLRWGLERLPLAMRWNWFRGMRLVSLTRIEDVRGVRHNVRIHDGWSFLDLIPTREAFSFLQEALEVLDAHARGEDDRKHELGLTSGPLITFTRDETIPQDDVARLASAWGPLWQELLQTVKPRLVPELQKRLEEA